MINLRTLNTIFLFGVLLLLGCKKVKLRKDHNAVVGKWEWSHTYTSTFNDATFEYSVDTVLADDPCNCVPGPKSIEFRKGCKLITNNQGRSEVYITKKPIDENHGMIDNGDGTDVFYLLLNRDKQETQYRFKVGRTRMTDTLVVYGFFPSTNGGSGGAGGTFINSSNYFVKAR